ncbi:MAG: 6-phosphogluconolactonase [Aquisalimonadaceae bacterium]
MTPHSALPAPIIERRFEDSGTLAEALADEVAARLDHALSERERASLIVSGGSTPISLFRELRTRPLPWLRIDVTLADERWVEPDHPDSNERLVRRELLQDAAAAANLIPLKTPADTPDAAIGECSARLSHLFTPFDVVILGMGNDGHTASLFPHTAALDIGLQPDGDALLVSCHPAEAPHARLSMTLSALLNTRHLVLHITGKDKRQVLEKALTGTEIRAMPIRALLQQNRTPIHVYWTG